jgi:hypothetical protein
LDPSVGDEDEDAVEELDGDEIEGVESSLSPLGTCCIAVQVGTNIEAGGALYGGLFREMSLGGNE